jgi:non-ribosomal peptide synthetase component F
LSILNRDFASLYAGKELAPLRVQYKDYAIWHNALMESPAMERLSEYWVNQLEGFTYTELPGNVTSSREQREGKIRNLRLDQDLTRRMQQFCQEHQMTQFAFVFGVFKIILAQTIQQDDLTVGIPVAGRSQEEMANMIGVFLNVLTIRTKIDKEVAFNQYLSKVNDDLIEAQERQDYPYEALYARAKEQWNFRHNSLFSILFNYMPYEGDRESKLDGITIRPYPAKELEPKYGLTLYVSEGQDRIGLNAVFQSSLDEKLVEIILNSFPTVIETVLKQEDVLIRELTLAGDHSLAQYGEEFTMEFDNDELF